MIFYILTIIIIGLNGKLKYMLFYSIITSYLRSTMGLPKSI